MVRYEISQSSPVVSETYLCDGLLENYIKLDWERWDRELVLLTSNPLNLWRMFMEYSGTQLFMSSSTFVFVTYRHLLSLSLSPFFSLVQVFKSLPDQSFQSRSIPMPQELKRGADRFYIIPFISFSNACLPPYFQPSFPFRLYHRTCKSSIGSLRDFVVADVFELRKSCDCVADGPGLAQVRFHRKKQLSCSLTSRTVVIDTAKERQCHEEDRNTDVDKCWN